MQTPEEMLDRWQGIECRCDPSVGHLCEYCHDTQVVRDLLRKYQQAIKSLEFIIGFDDVDDLIVDIASKAIEKSR